jgi:hypothetical protein
MAEVTRKFLLSEQPEAFSAKAMLTQTNAFVPPDVADERGLRLELPEKAAP